MPGAETRASAPGEVFSLADKMGGRWGSQGWEEAVRQRVEGEVGERDGRWGEGFSMKRPGINLRAAAGVSSGHLCSSLGLPPSAVCPVGCVPLSAAHFPSSQVPFLPPSAPVPDTQFQVSRAAPPSPYTLGKAHNTLVLLRGVFCGNWGGGRGGVSGEVPGLEAAPTSQ